MGYRQNKVKYNKYFVRANDKIKVDIVDMLNPTKRDFRTPSLSFIEEAKIPQNVMVNPHTP